MINKHIFLPHFIVVQLSDASSEVRRVCKIAVVRKVVIRNSRLQVALINIIRNQTIWNRMKLNRNAEWPLYLRTGNQRVQLSYKQFSLSWTLERSGCVLRWSHGQGPFEQHVPCYCLLGLSEMFMDSYNSVKISQFLLSINNCSVPEKWSFIICAIRVIRVTLYYTCSPVTC